MNSQPYLLNNNEVMCSVSNCRTAPQNSYQCSLTQYRPCPSWNGSYAQCTNNFQHKVNIANCSERSFYYSPYDERLSQKCVYKHIHPFAVKERTYNPSNPSVFPRVGLWRGNTITGNFFIQGN